MLRYAQQKMQPAVQTVQQLFQQSWLLRWVLANMLGWSLGLLLAALLLTHLGIVGALTGGAVAGTIVGSLQAVALKTHPVWQPHFRAWVWYSGLGGAAATVPIYLLAFGLLLNFNVTLVLMGAVFGTLQASLQARLWWHSVDERALWWIIASAIGGAACAPLSLSAASFWLPVCFSPGPLLFGLITGVTLLKISANYETSDDA
jgi:hypothetical protein